MSTATVLFPANVCDTNDNNSGAPIPVSLDRADVSTWRSAAPLVGQSFSQQILTLLQNATQKAISQLTIFSPAVPCHSLPTEITLPAQAAIFASTETPVTSSSTVAIGSTSSKPASSAQVSPLQTPGTANEPANQTVIPKPHSNAGPMAGVGVGCLILGILIGAAVLFLLGFRRRRAPATTRGQPESTYGQTGVKNGYSESKSGATVSPSMSMPMNSAAAIIERNIPDPIADNDIISEFSKVDDKINGHVNSFYMQNATTDHLAAAQAIAPLLGAGSSMTLQKINALLANPQTRSNVLRFAIAKTLISRMDSDGASTNALLPFGTAATIRGMPKVQANDQTRMAFMTKWRAITAYLMGIPSNTNTVSEESVRQTVLDCDNFVGPYAPANIDQQARLQNLEEICRRAGRVAGMLFSQQSTFKFEWAHLGPGLVVFPGLVKITDEAGCILQQPIVFAEKRVVQI